MAVKIAVFPSMSHVLKVCGPLKVLYAVILFVTIEVIYLRLVIGVWNEMFGYEAVDFAKYLFSIPLKDNS